MRLKDLKAWWLRQPIGAREEIKNFIHIMLFGILIMILAMCCTGCSSTKKVIENNEINKIENIVSDNSKTATVDNVKVDSVASFNQTISLDNSIIYIDSIVENDKTIKGIHIELKKKNTNTLTVQSKSTEDIHTEETTDSTASKNVIVDEKTNNSTEIKTNKTGCPRLWLLIIVVIIAIVLVKEFERRFL